MATDWPEEQRPSFFERVMKLIFWFAPEANPGYEGKMHLVREWFIEFGDDNLPWREIGVGADGKPILAGPDENNYGFWLDTNMEYENFEGESVDKEEFECLWKESGVQELE